MKQRILSAILVLAVILSAFSALTVTAGAVTTQGETNPTLEISKVNVSTPDMAYVTVSLTGNPGISCLDFELSFDLNIARIVSYAIAPELEGATFNADGLRFSWQGEEDVAYNGEILALRLDIRANLPVRELYDIGAQCMAGNVSGELVSFGIEEGSILVIEQRPESDHAYYLDVYSGTPYYDAATYLSDQGIMQGIVEKTETTKGEFQPDRRITRGELAVIFWRMAGKRTALNVSLPADCDRTAAYGEAVKWVLSTGIMEYTGASTFSPDKTVNRQETLTYIYNFLCECTYIADSDVYASKFESADLSNKSSFSASAKRAIGWAYSVALFTDKDLKGTDPCTRGDTAEYIYRVYRIYQKKHGLIVVNTKDADWAAGERESMEELFAAYGVEHLISQQDIKKTQFSTCMNETFGKAKALDLCYLYCSAHGVQDSIALFSDGSLTAVMLQDELLKYNNGTFIVMLTACFSGSFITGSTRSAGNEEVFSAEKFVAELTQTGPVKRVGNITIAPRIRVLCAAQEDQYGWCGNSINGRYINATHFWCLSCGYDNRYEVYNYCDPPADSNKDTRISLEELYLDSEENLTDWADGSRIGSNGAPVIQNSARYPENDSFIVFEREIHKYDSADATVCTSCGYARTITHTHDFSAMRCNETEHWNVCTICHEESDNRSAHEFCSDAVACYCSVCGYMKGYDIKIDTQYRYDLSKLPGDFDSSKTSNWKGGSVDDENENILIVTPGTSEVFYDYDCGNGTHISSKLNVLGVEINETNFPDANFRAFISGEEIDMDLNGILSPAELIISRLDVRGKEIKSLEGLECFTAITSLDCSGNLLESLVVTGYPLLTELRCNNNSLLKSLVVTGNPSLKNVYCNSNQLLESANISDNTALTRLECYCNAQLKSLNICGNKALESLYCYDNKLTELDMSTNIALVMLSCFDNQLAKLVVRENKALESLYCYGNEITELDISENTALKTLHCGADLAEMIERTEDTSLTASDCGNKLTELDVSKNTNLTSLNCDNNHITELDVSKNTNLTSLNCDNNQITELDVSKNTNLTSLYCNNNQLTKLMISKNSELKYLFCSGNQLETLDVSGNTKLITLKCSDNRITTLDLSENAALAYLFCDGNQLTKLDVSKNTALKQLTCSSNQLAALDVSKNTKLTTLDCSNNQYGITINSAYEFDLSTLPGDFDVGKASAWAGGNVSGNILTVDETATEVTYTYDCGNDRSASFKLKVLENGIAINGTNFPDPAFRAYVAGATIDQNADGVLSAAELGKVTSMDVSGKGIADLKGIEHFTSLGYLVCSDNKLKTLDVSGNTKLHTLNCSNNQIKTLKLGENTTLLNLFCSDNQIEELDLSNTINIEEMNCSGNLLTKLDVSALSILYIFDCSDNQLTALDVSRNTALEDLYCSNNCLTSLDLTNTIIANFSPANNQYGITINLAYEFDLSTLPGDFDVSKASAWAGGTVSGNILTVTPGVTEVTYTYDCGNDQSASFKLKVLKIGIAINETNFPDPAFRAYVAGITIDRNADGVLSAAEISRVTEINIPSKRITSLKGIEYFTALTTLNCNNNRLTSLNVSKNTALTTLNCSSNRITTLDLSENTALQRLSCAYNQLKTLDVSKLTSLKELDCGGNKLTALNVEKNGKLTVLDCRLNQLTKLYVGNNYSLTDLNCGSNKLTELDVHHNEELVSLRCYGNQLKELDLMCHRGLETLECYTNQLTWLDLSYNPELSYLDCEENQLTSLDVSTNLQLQTLLCGYNQIKTLELGENAALLTLYCSENQLKELDLSNTINIEEVECSDSLLTALNVSKNKNLATLVCVGNQITMLDVSSNPKLQTLNCGRNQIETLKLGENTTLLQLDCYDNQLEELDLSNTINIAALNCCGNLLTALDVSRNTVLKNLYCSNNQITTLDVSQNTALAYFYCGNNPITTLDVSKNTALKRLICGSNQLTALDVSKNTNLITLDCRSNQYGITINSAYEFDLSTLPGDFDVSKASAWAGGTVSGNTLTVAPGVTEATYTYDCGNGKSASFRLTVLGKKLSSVISKENVSTPPGIEIAINETNFPDPAFRAYVADATIDQNADGVLTASELGEVTSMNVSGKGIVDLKGIEHFTSLGNLDCSDNQITSLDVSMNTALKHLNCDNDQYGIVLNSAYEFDLSTLPGDFDVSKASAWAGGTVSGNILTVDETAAEVTYTYDCGDDWSASFKLLVLGKQTFRDVPPSAWYYEGVEFCARHDYVFGTGNGNYSPDENINRAMLVTLLWRYAGQPTGDENTFTDVPADRWYTKAIDWAAGEGIVAGVGGDRFDPEGLLTREQMATLFYRCAQATGMDTAARADLRSYPDHESVSKWAEDALSWAVAEGLIDGVKVDGVLHLNPKGEATRAQLAVIFMRYVQNIAEAK